MIRMRVKDPDLIHAGSNLQWLSLVVVNNAMEQ